MIKLEKETPIASIAIGLDGYKTRDQRGRVEVWGRQLRIHAGNAVGLQVCTGMAQDDVDGASLPVSCKSDIHRRGYASCGLPLRSRGGKKRDRRVPG